MENVHLVNKIAEMQFEKAETLEQKIEWAEKFLREHSPDTFKTNQIPVKGCPTHIKETFHDGRKVKTLQISYKLREGMSLSSEITQTVIYEISRVILAERLFKVNKYKDHESFSDVYLVSVDIVEPKKEKL